jgi:hypothetical protein
VSDLHERAAKALGWSVRDAQSLSMQGLRELVRPVDPALAREMDYMIQSGAYIRGEPLARKGKSRGHATTAGTKIWKRVDWKAPGATEPIKYSWELVRPHVRADEVDEWLAIYHHDNPGVTFVAAETKPRAKKGPKIIRGPGSEYGQSPAHRDRSRPRRDDTAGGREALTLRVDLLGRFLGFLDPARILDLGVARVPDRDP